MTQKQLRQHFGKQLRLVRFGLTRTDFATITDISRQYVHDLEIGKKTPSMYTIYKIAKGLRVKPSELVRSVLDGA